MGTSIIQPSFTGGELSPSLYGRVDLARYQTSARTLRNFMSLMYGGATNRPGFRFVHEVKDSARRTRLIPFQFSTVQTYVIEVGHQYMRFYMNGGIIESSPGVPYEIVTPYDEADIFELKFTQSADVITICHNNYAPRQLSRLAHTNWTLTEFNNRNGPFQEVNINTNLTIQSSGTTGTVTLTSTGVSFNSSMIGMLLYLEDAHPEQVKPWVNGSPNLPLGTRCRSDGKVYNLTGQPSPAGTSGYRTGGNRPVHSEGSAWDGDGNIEQTGAYADGVEWTYLHSGFGIVRITGVSSSTTATAATVARLPDSVATTGTHKWAFGAWGGNQGFPACVTYHQERQIFAATVAQPQAYWMSRIGAYNDFGVSSPVQDDDAISKTVPGRQVNAIRHLLPIDDLIILTSGAEFKVITNSDGAITPSSATAKPQTYNGSSHLSPIIIVDTALYVQEKGSIVRDLAYTYDKDKFTGNDLTTLSSHLFTGYQLVDWAYSQVPNSIVWAVRNDGTLLGLTYLKEQQVAGWHRHDTKNGTFESVCVISEGLEDVLYVVVRRFINGQYVRYVERLETRQVIKVEDGFFVDSGLTYDGRNQPGTLTLSGGTQWDHTETLTATLSGASITLSSSSVGDAFFLTDSVDPTIQYRLEIVDVTDSSTCTVRPNRQLPADKRGVNTKWDYAILDVGGLGHLEGETVSILADGSVHAQRVVDNGTIQLQEPAAIVHVGLPIEADFETLDLNVPDGETIRDKQKIISAVRLIVQDSRGMWAGPDADHLYELKQREFENYDEPVRPLTGLAEFLIDSNWDKPGRVLVRQYDPLPATILAAIPEATVAGA